MHSYKVHSNESACRKKVRLGMEQVSTPTAPLELTPYGKYYPCFQIDRKTAQASQCTKSRALTKVIDSILDIESFDQKFVVVKGSLQ